MTGIVGAALQSNVTPYLVNCLKLSEFDGFDAVSIFVVNDRNIIDNIESKKKVGELENLLLKHPIQGKVGIANTYWSKRTYLDGRYSHPKIADDAVGLVHNGIIENNEKIKKMLLKDGYSLESGTDGELIGYLVFHYTKMGDNFLSAVRRAEKQLEGYYSACFIQKEDPLKLKALRRGSTLIVGMGDKGNFVTSEFSALKDIANKFIYLEEGDIADVSAKEVVIYDQNDVRVERQVYVMDDSIKKETKGKYNHYILKEIYDQSDTILTTLQGRLTDEKVLVDAFGANAHDYFSRIHRVQIVTSDTSYHAGLVGRYWMEAISGLPCTVELATEGRYRQKVVDANTLFVTLSPSGETPDVMDAFRMARNLGYTATLSIGDAPESTLMNESDLTLLTGTGARSSLTDIKDFAAQLSALSLLAMSLGKYHGLDNEQEASLAKKIRNIPAKSLKTLNVDPLIKELVPNFDKSSEALYLGDGIQFPVAMEGATRLEKISSMNAEAFFAYEFSRRSAELMNQSIVALLPEKDEDFESIFTKINLEKQKNFLVFTDEKNGERTKGSNIVSLPSVDKLLAPMTYVIPMQLLAYHVALNKGDDADKYYMKEAWATA